ncbi:TPA: hypothetical protein ACIRVE_003996 [Pseudomonas putida]|uniref:hypothetical protein n=1 Tax=Pseudomonas sp. TaxID=306 RepID=UPI0028A80D28|nr:hypothetical protein [Pseudomonas sp.]
MKKTVLLWVLLLSGCVDGRFFLLPNQQDLKFACDMDPYKPGCERQSDYDRHFKSVEDSKR